MKSGAAAPNTPTRGLRGSAPLPPELGTGASVGTQMREAHGHLAYLRNPVTPVAPGRGGSGPPARWLGLIFFEEVYAAIACKDNGLQAPLVQLRAHLRFITARRLDGGRRFVDHTPSFFVFLDT